MKLNQLTDLFEVFVENKENNTPTPKKFFNNVSEVWEEITDKRDTNNALQKRFYRWYVIYLKMGMGYTLQFITSYLSEYVDNNEDEDIDNIQVEAEDEYEYLDAEEGELEEDVIQTTSIISEYKKKVFKDNENGNHVFFLKSAPKPLVVTNEDLKRLKERYSNWDGVDSTINEICRDFKIPRPWFIELKSVMGWTHDSDPFLDDEILNKDDDVLIEEALMNRRANLYQKFEVDKWNEVKKEAQKYRELETFVVKPIIEKLDSISKPYEQIPFNIDFELDFENHESCWVLPPFDLHIGKMSYPDTNIPFSVYKAEILTSYAKLIERGLKNGLPSVIYVPLGSDMFHVDTFQATTTRGTQQTNNMSMHVYDMLIDGYLCGFELTDMIVDLGIPVKFFNVAGNHDRLLSLNFLLSVNQRYRNVEHVETITNKELRHYITYGTNLLTFTHGDELPMTGLRRNYTLQKFLIHEAKYQLQSNSMLFDNFYFFSGHLHKAKTEDAEGVYDIIVPSLAKPDYWHHEKGYIASHRKASLYVLSKTEGLISTIYSKP
jgi:hypothetical protein